MDRSAADSAVDKILGGAVAPALKARGWPCGTCPNCVPSSPGSPPRLTRTRGRTCSRPMPGQPMPYAATASHSRKPTVSVPDEPSNPPAPPTTPDNHWLPDATWSTSSPGTSALSRCPDRGA